jgi:hypothetical protein
MTAGVRGRLISSSFAREGLPAIAGAAAPLPAGTARALRLLTERIDATLGPASSVRAITDVAVIPLLRLLGFDVRSRIDTPAYAVLQTAAGGAVTPVVMVFPWADSLEHAWRTAVINAIANRTDWCFCTNGRTLRIVDGVRTWCRDHLEFDLPALAGSAEPLTLLWSVARADAMCASPTVLGAAASASTRHGVHVSRALGDGVLEATTLLLTAVRQRSLRTRSGEAALDDALTILYRVLFLLFAEARGLVPVWHPIYRNRYSLETIVSTLLDGRSCRGLWQAVQAISRMAHAGCAAGELTVNAFNGRLFAPARSTTLDRTAIDDRTMRDAILAVSTTRTSPRTPRRRIVYGDLDVEQLGAVYERILDYEPEVRRGAPALVKTRDVRKATGSFYTPRPVTAFVARQALAPLVEGRSASEILSLRILDPAMGSGAFLVAACRFLAAAAEEALIRDGQRQRSEIDAADRAALRRDVASRCLYGVDLNPTAVQLARLSLWLATLAADKPLSFLDHHLIDGDSLIGADPRDIARQPSRGSRRRRHRPLPLFGDDLGRAFTDAAAMRMKLVAEPDDSAVIVRRKEQTLAALRAPGTDLQRWWRALDLWCAGWFWDGHPPDRATFGELLQIALDRPSTLRLPVANSMLTTSDAIAARCRFLHWPLAFPEVFAAGANGFDAVIGNPPWDMVRGDSGGVEVRGERRQEARQLVAFARESGVYRVEARAHVNRYQLFVERALQLVRPGGRVGLVLPAGAVTDAGAAALRRHLFDRADVDSVTGLDNRGGIFPIHRSMRFVLLTATAGRPTSEIGCRFGVSHPDGLDADTAATGQLRLTRTLLARLSGDDDLAIPELSSRADLRIVERISAHVPPLGGAAGWAVQFGRELNATDDRHAFVAFVPASTGRPVVEGKQIDPFRVDVDGSRLMLAADARQSRRVPRRARLAYRDVASATNRLTLIAAVVPARAVTTHTLFCLRTPLPIAEQQVLCALLNSFVVNYLVRLRVNTHVTVAIVSKLPIPLVREGHPRFAHLQSLAATLLHGHAPAETMPEYAELQAIVAKLYGLAEADFAHILQTFPLIPQAVRDAALTSFRSGR